MTADSPPTPGSGRSWIDHDQAEILSERYLMMMVGEPAFLGLLLLQAPFIAGMIVLAWSNSKESPTLFLFLCLAALWIGCVNACREIVKERPILQRERRMGLDPTAYLLSKLYILGGLCGIQCTVMVSMVHYWVGLSGSKIGLVLALWITALTGTVLGLAVSALVSSSDKAVGLVPLVILPQILFTRPFLPPGSETGIAHRLENFTLLGWGQDLYGHVRTLGFDPHFKDLARCLGALTALGIFLFALALLLLGRHEGPTDG